MAELEDDFKELLKCFNKRRVRFCIVGAFAVGFYALPRYTKDLDILVEATEANGERVVAALKDFGFGSLKLEPDDFTKPGRFIQLGYEPLRIDLITSIDGVDFNKVWKGRKTGQLGGEKVSFIGLMELIKNKIASGRKQDLADLEILKKIKNKKR